MITNTPSHNYHYTSLDGQHSFFDQYGCRAVLVWLSSRFLRSGHKLIIQVVACVAALLLIAHSLPQRASDVALGRGYSSFLGWARGKASAAADDASEATGLRVVVFGASDIATLPDKKNGDVTWSEIMCEELECSTYISLVPKPPSRSMLSNDLYAAAVDKVVKASPSKASASPGLDYSFYPKHFPVPSNAPDFSKQVTEFLSRPTPRESPKETIWVLNFGHWDVWNLAALPLQVSQTVIDGMVADVVVNIERLYKASSNETSIAYSNIQARTESASPALLPKLQKPALTVGDGAMAVPDEQAAQSFRVIVPMIFDPTLTPGWKTERPVLPTAHSKAEQMRNAATLTERWNNKLQNAIEDWVKFDEREAKLEAQRQHDAETSKPTTTTARFTADPAAATATATPTAAPAPIRDAIIYDLQEYVAEMIAERQLRNQGYVDQKGVGGRAEEKMFREVASPCINATMYGLNAAKSWPASPRDDEDDDYEPATRRRSRRAARSLTAAAQDKGSPQISSVCQEPREHLFYGPLALSYRAIDEIGKETAELVVSNMTLRGYWASLIS